MEELSILNNWHPLLRTTKCINPCNWERLTLSTHGKNFSRRQIFFLFFFFQEKWFDFSCKLSPLHEMSNPYFWENKKKTINLSSLELAHKVVKVNPMKADNAIRQKAGSTGNTFCLESLDKNKAHEPVPIRKRVFGHMRTAGDQISLCIRAVWLGP